MQEDVRRILKVAAPFAGVALGWYLFLPNLRYLEAVGEYKSQFLINLHQVKSKIDGFHYRLTTPKEVRDYIPCSFEAMSDLVDISFATPLEEYEKVPDSDQFIFDRCGPDPREDS